MQHNVRDSYQEAQVLSSSPLELVRLLYRGAIESIVEARQCLAGRDIAGRAQAINRALAIVIELSASLDHRHDAELSRTLAELYDYVQRLLIDANCRQVDPPLREAQALLATLQDAWKSCEPGVRIQPPGMVTAGYQPVSVAG